MGASLPPSPKPISGSSAKSFSVIGDSRAAQWSTTTNDSILSTNGNSWFHKANAINRHNMFLIGNYGISGGRSDQYLANNLATMLVDSSERTIFNFPGVNDISQAITPYTSTFTPTLGANVTTSNVAQIVATNIMYAANLALSVGKRPLIVTETGSNSFNSAQIGAVHDLNEYLRDYAESTPNVDFLDFTGVTWNQTSSNSAIVFNTGFMTENPHFTGLCAYYQGVLAASYFATQIAPYESRVSSINDINTNTSRQICQNPMFVLTTGGSTAGSGIITGSVPSGWSLKAPLSTTSVTVTSAAEPNGYGNTITLAITATASDLVTFYSGPASNAWWNIGDIIDSEIDVSVATGSSNCSVQLQQSMDIDGVTPNCWDLYEQNNKYGGAGPTTAYKYTLRTPKQTAVGTTKSYIEMYLGIYFVGAGSATVTISRAKMRRRIS